MKSDLKTSKWLRWITASVFGLMLVLNIMVSLEFENGKFLPSITLTELGNMAMAQSENGGGDDCPGCVPDMMLKSVPCVKLIAEFNGTDFTCKLWTGDKMKCKSQSGAFCNQNNQTPCQDECS